MSSAIGRLPLGLALMAPLISGCSSREAPPATLTVFAASSLTGAFKELGAEFEQSNQSVRVQFNFAGSQQLVLQLEQGGRADVFASADSSTMRKVQGLGLVEGAVSIAARNHLAVIVPASNPARVERLEHLARPGLKLVLAAPAVPAGRYSREALSRIERMPGFSSGYAEAVLRNVVSNEENVKGVVSKVELGEADAGIVYRSDVVAVPESSIRVLLIPPASNVTAAYPIAVMRGSRQSTLARQFVQWVLSPEGQATLARHGFVPAGSAE